MTPPRTIRRFPYRNFWDHVTRGNVWGMRGDGKALASEHLFGGDFGAPVVVTVTRYKVGPGLRDGYELTRECEYGHRLWQPDSFLIPAGVRTV